MTYGQRLRRLRERAGLSLREVEERTEGAGQRVTIQMISRYERDEAMPRADTLPALAAAYGVRVSEVVPGHGGGVNPAALEAAIDEAAKVAKLRDAMVRECYLTPKHLAKRYGVDVETIYRWDPPRTKIPTSRNVFYHPLDILEWEQRPDVQEWIARAA